MTDAAVLAAFEAAARKYVSSQKEFTASLDSTITRGIERLIKAQDCSILGGLAVRAKNAGLPEKQIKAIFADLVGYLDHLAIPGIVPASRAQTILCRAKEIKAWATADMISDTMAVIDFTPFSAWREAKKDREKAAADPADKAKKLASQLARHISDNGLQRSDKWQAILEALRTLD